MVSLQGIPTIFSPAMASSTHSCYSLMSPIPDADADGPLGCRELAVREGLVRVNTGN
jgi:hypothetical protein